MSQAVMTWNLGELTAIKDALNKAGSTSFKPMMTSLAMEIEEQTRDRFLTKVDPDGSPWAEWSDPYKERLLEKGIRSSILSLNNFLEESITHNFSGTNANSMRIEVGSPLIYAATHQYGDDDRGFPARAYLGISAENEADLGCIVNDFIAGLFED